MHDRNTLNRVLVLCDFIQDVISQDYGYQIYYTNLVQI